MGDKNQGPLPGSPQNINDGTLSRARASQNGVTGAPRRVTPSGHTGDLPQIIAGPAVRASTIGTGAGIDHFINGKTGVTVNGENFIITGRPAQGMRVPKTGTTSVLFVYKKSNPNKLYRLDYDVLKMGPNAGQQGWEHNQSGVAKILNLAVTNHEPAGAWASAAGKAIKVLRYGGKALLVVGAIESGIEIYYAPDKKGAILTEAGGWIGATGGAELGAEGGAAIGGAIGVWFFGAGAVPGAAIGAFIGGVGGGIAGYAGGKAAVSYVYHKLTDEEEWIVVEPPPGVQP